jgi:ribulose-phosphate 3-epimerase
MNQIIPAFLVQDEASFRERLAIVDGLADEIQIDVMDGKFVANKTWCDLKALAHIESKSTFELHLMVEDPEPWIHAAVDVPSIKRVVWHVEAMGDHRELVELCQDYEKEAGLAISPKTPIDILRPYVFGLSEILILGVEPGFSGQAVLPGTIEKARAIHAEWPTITLAWDGGLTEQNIERIRDAGITRFCAASAIFDATDPAVALEQLRRA